MPHEELMQDLARWCRYGWIRPIEEYFVRMLAELEPQTSDELLLIATLTSHQFGRGHIGLPLAEALADPAGLLQLPPASDPGTDEDLLRDQAAAKLRARLQALEHEALLAEMTTSRLFDDGAGTAPLVHDGQLVYLRRSWQAEREIATIVASMGGPAAMPLRPDQLRLWINALFASHADEQIALPSPDSPDSDLQRHGWQKVACALAARNRLTVISGGPGTGKTWTVVKILAMLQVIHMQDSEEPLRIRLAAPTGKAAQRLDESIRDNWQALPEQFQGVDLIRPERASTLHRLLGSQLHTRHFRHGRGNRLHADVVIVDEASMIDQELMHALVSALRPQTRLILLGDKDQLASVEAGAVFGDLCEGADEGGYAADTVKWLHSATGYDLADWQGAGGLADQRVMLRWNHRSRQQIDKLARLINAGQGDDALEWIRSTENDGLYWLEPESENDDALRKLILDGVPGQSHGFGHYLKVIREQRHQLGATPDRADIDRWASDCLTAQGKFQLLCAVRRGPWGVEAVNRRIHGWLADRGWVQRGHEWFEGRPVMITRNDYRTGLMNGDLGLCLDVPDESGEVHARVVFAREKGQLDYFSPGRIRWCETAWAMTVHKSQGSEFEHAALMLPERDNRVLTTELIYTGITRARDFATVIAPESAVFTHGISTRTRRHSRLAELLRNEAPGPPGICSG